MNPRPLCATLLLSVLAAPALALEIAPAIDPGSVTGDYPYNILGLKPGDTTDRLLEVAEEKGIAVEVNRGTYTLEAGSKSIGIDLNYSFSTIGYENYYTYRYEPSWDILGGSLTSPATSSVIGSLGRQLAIPRADAPSYEAFRLQLVERYGEPSWEGSSTLGQSLWWVEDRQGNLITFDAEPGRERDEPGDEAGTGSGEPCTFYGGQPDYMDAEARSREPECSVHFSATYEINSQNINLRFGLSDDVLVFEDHRAFSEQIDVELNGAQAPSDLDL